MERVSALDLYAGDHWTVARELPHAAARRGKTAHLWVASAGYGLIRATDAIASYAATFDRAHPDSVGHDLPTQRAWWAELARWRPRGLPSEQPRTLADLVAQEPEATYMVVASPTYLNPLAEDLRRAAARANETERVLLISSGATAKGGFEDLLLPSDARFHGVVGGTRQALNVRVARWLLADLPGVPLKRRPLTESLRRKASELPELQKHDRSTMTDDDVMTFIRNELAAEPRAAKSPLLRRLRDHGQACEQKRFGRLYERIREERHGDE